jgi:hypothetical protein
MNIFRVLSASFVIALSLTIVPSTTSSIAAPAPKTIKVTPVVAAPVEPAKRDNLRRGDVTLPIEVSPFFKPQLGLAIPRM